MAINERYESYDDIQNIPDRLCWLRHRRGLSQPEAAQMLGMTDTSYKDLESGTVRRIRNELAQKLAALFGVPVTDFLDAYSAFLYHGQAASIRAYREKWGLSRKDFSAKMGIKIERLERWEEEQTVLSYKSWERYFHSG